LTKIQLVYSVSYLNLGGSFVWGAKPTKNIRAMGVD